MTDDDDDDDDIRVSSAPPCNALTMCGLQKHHCPAAPVTRKGCFNRSSTSIMKYFCFPK